MRWAWNRFLVCGLLAAFQAPVDLRTETAPQREARLRERTQRGSGWRLEVLPEYFVLTDLEDRNLPRGLGERGGLLLREIERDFDPPKPDAPWLRTPSVIHLYSTAEGFHAAGGLQGESSFWRGADASLHLSGARESAGRRDVERALQCLVFAEYVDLRGGPGGHSPWFLFGHQQYYSGYESKQGKLEPKPREDWRALVSEMLKPNHDSWVPLERLVQFTAGEFNGRNRLGIGGTAVWAQGWSLIWFLRQGAGSKGWKPRWGEIPRLYWAEWRVSRDPEIATQLAFAGVDFAELERAWAAASR